MKKLILSVFFAVVAALSSFAASSLKCMELFDGRYEDDPRVSVVKKEGNGGVCYMEMSVKNAAYVVSAMQKAVNKDRETSSSSEVFDMETCKKAILKYGNGITVVYIYGGNTTKLILKGPKTAL